MSVRYNFDKLEFIQKYDELKSSRKMGLYYNCSSTTILNYARKIWYDYNQHLVGKLSDKDKNYIVSQYNNKTTNELAKEFNTTRGVIAVIWMKAGLKGKDIHAYKFNYDYFENIDSSDKAYFLGLLAADGCVYKRNKGASQSMIHLALHKDDVDILKLFSQQVGSTKPFQYINNAVSIELVSDKMAEDLAKYGITPKKTYSYRMSLLPNYMSHFIRGYFDGDGCITVNRKRGNVPSSYSVSFSGFIENLLILKEYLNKLGIMTSLIKDERPDKYSKKGGVFGSLIINNIESIYRFLKYIYNDSDKFYLSRKYERANAFFEAIKSNRGNKENKYVKIIRNCERDLGL